MQFLMICFRSNLTKCVQKTNQYNFDIDMKYYADIRRENSWIIATNKVIKRFQRKFMLLAAKLFIHLGMDIPILVDNNCLCTTISYAFTISSVSHENLTSKKKTCSREVKHAYKSK